MGVNLFHELDWFLCILGSFNFKLVFFDWSVLTERNWFLIFNFLEYDLVSLEYKILHFRSFLW